MRPSILPTIALVLMLLGAGAFGTWFLMSQGEPTRPPAIAADVSIDDTEPAPKRTEGTVDRAPEIGPAIKSDASNKPATDDATLNKAKDSNKETTRESETAGSTPAGNPPVTELRPRTEELDAWRRKAVEFERAALDDGKPPVAFLATISGKVTDSKNSPIAGASIHGNSLESLEFSSLIRSRAYVEAPGAPAAPKGSPLATTDSSGNFTIKVDRQVREGARVSISLTASAEGYATSRTQTVTVANAETKDGITLALRGAGSVVGRVVDSSGRGLEGVKVTLASAGSGTESVYLAGDGVPVLRGMGGSAPPPATTDSTGNFTMTGIAEGRYRPTASATGWRQLAGPTEITVRTGEEARFAADFVMTAAAQLKVTLSTPEGSALRGGISVQFIDGSTHVATRTARAAQDGTFVVNDAPVGSFAIRISVNGYNPVNAKATIIDGQPTDLGSFTLEKSPASGAAWPTAPAQPK